LLDRLGIAHPIVQAPMAGVSTPAMAAAVSRAGGLGSVRVGALDVQGAAEVLAELRELAPGPININVFCHRPAARSPALEAAWIERLRPEFQSLGAEPPPALREIYRSFNDDHEMQTLLLKERPAVLSFHFGLPPGELIAALRGSGIALLASATSLAEARAAAAAGVDAVVAQGWEAGGHRGVFDSDDHDDRLGVLALTRILVRELDLPVIAAGGIMDGAGIAAALRLGATAAQLGTAFIACDESAADPGYRAALTGRGVHRTVMTRAISGRPARCLANRFTALAARVPDQAVPAYPVAYDLGKALHRAATANGGNGFGPHWAGQGAPLARTMPAGALVETLAAELAEAGGIP
jgi:nitronate monooxygenase